jgi:hypothetical protein
VPWSFERAHSYSSEFDGISIAKGRERVFGPGSSAEVNRGAGPIPELEMAGEKVRVKVRQEDVTDLEVMLCGKRKILIDVPLRIDDCGDVCRFIADEIRRVGEAIQVELLDEHPAYDTPSPSIRGRRSA